MSLSPKRQATPPEVPFTKSERKLLDRDIAGLAIPALGALIAEPIFLATDSAMVGHLGADALGGLAIASTLLHTLIGLMIFLAYATTPMTARRLGAGDTAGAYGAGITSIGLAIILGVMIAVIGLFAGDWMIQSLNPEAGVAEAAADYFFVSLLGMPAMLIVFAATGLLRGLQDTKTPLAIAVAGFGLNIVLNFVLIYGLNFGVAGSAWGLVVVQWLMVAAFIVVIAVRMNRAKVSIRPDIATVLMSLRLGWWLFLRTLTLRAALLMTVAAGTALGTEALASYQVVITLYNLTAFALDALAIAAQAMVGKVLGEGDSERAKAVIRRTAYWGIVSGLVMMLVLAAGSFFLGRIFTSDPGVLAIVPWAVLVLALSLPLGGIVFVYDGVLMGAGDVRYLALAGFINIAVYIPVLLVLQTIQLSGLNGIILLTFALCFIYNGMRALTLWLRIRTPSWMVLGRR